MTLELSKKRRKAMLKLTMAMVISLLLMMPDFANSMMKMSGVTQAEKQGDSGKVVQATWRHSSAALVGPIRFVKHWWNVPCAVTDRKGRGGTFERTFRVCANSPRLQGLQQTMTVSSNTASNMGGTVAPAKGSWRIPILVAATKVAICKTILLERVSFWRDLLCC
jgi:hypothetical protein